MFRKIVSSLPFSPALVGQLGFYAKRLKKEELTRRLGLIFTVLAVIMQSFTVFSPPEQALASNGSDIIPGGITSVAQVLSTYDAGSKGQNDFKDLMDYLGITRGELADMSHKVEYVCSSDKDWISFGRQHHYSASEGELVHNVPRQAGGVSKFYSVPLYRFDSVNNHINCYDSYIGTSKKAGKFSIMRKCGNIQIKKDIQKFPKGHFVTATCKTIQGYAYDERQTGLPVKVYLFFGGPPGKGKQYGPLTANQASPSSPVGSGHGFNFAVPEEYQKSTKPTVVWATLQPLAGWNQPAVQFDNKTEIPGNCVPPQTPTASCVGLTKSSIDRTKLKLQATAETEQSATITSYSFTVVDSSGKKVYEETVTSGNKTASSKVIEPTKDGKYVAKVVVNTSVGPKTSAECEVPFEINPTDKCPYPGSGGIEPNNPECKPCPQNEKLWINDPDCSPTITQSKEAKNLTKNISDANGTTAAASDRIEFVVNTTNIGSTPITTSVTESLTDILEYARLIDAGGGVMDQQTKILSWGDVKLDPQKNDTRRFVVQLLDAIPATPRGANNPAAFNCVMTNAYGNTIEIMVECPAVKSVETTVKDLPRTGPTENVLFGSVLLMAVTYFYARSRQMHKEALLVRKDF